MHEAFEGYYPSEFHTEIARILKRQPNQLGDDFMEEVAKVAFCVGSGKGLHVESEKKSSRDALREVSKHARGLIEALEELDPSSWNALVEVSHQQLGAYGLDSDVEDVLNEMTLFDERGKRLHAWLLHIKLLDQLVVPALSTVRAGGRPTNDIPWAIAELRKIWTATTRTEPTLSYNSRTKTASGDFLRFCQIVLNSVLLPNEAPLKLERAVRNELYGQKPRRSSDRLNP
jgi:hypothetical protein